MSLYIVDSNFFIQAHRAYYPLDVIQSFWVKVKQLAEEGKIKSIDKVKNEIYSNASHEDELKDWCDEKSEPNRKSRIKIPEVCNQFGVRYINTVDLLRELNENI